jgi:hypothetical protein
MPLPATLQAQPRDETTTRAPIERALEWARWWYPTARLTPTGTDAARASVLVEDGDEIRILTYEDLDADVPKCEICGRPL